MKRVTIMCRVSSDDQAKGYSLDDQRERLTQYCQRNNYEIVYEIVEDHSAKTFERPEWKKWYSLVKSKQIEVDEILFTSWDRFSRDLLGALTMIKLLRETDNIIPQSIEQPINYDIPENLFMLAIYLANPDVDNQRRSIKIRGGIRQALKQGRWPRKRVFGYRSQRDSLGKSILVPHPEEARAVKYIYEEVIAGTPQSEIRKVLVAKGFTISKNNLCLMLKRELYAGKIVIPSEGEEPLRIIEGVHESIITELLFYKVQQVLFENRKVRNKSIPKYAKMRSDFPLRGVLKCNECANIMTGSLSKGKLGKKYGYYHCNHCKKQRVSIDVVHQAFDELLQKVNIDPNIIVLYNQILESLLDGTKKDGKVESKKLKSKIDQINKRLAVSQDLMLDGKIDAEDYKEIKARCVLQKNELQVKSCNYSFNKRDFSTYAKSGLNLLSNLPKAYYSATIKLKHQLVGSIFPDLFSFDGKICRTPNLNPVLSLFASIDRGLVKNKKGQLIRNYQLSPSVEEKGFEPPIPL